MENPCTNNHSTVFFKFLKPLSRLDFNPLTVAHREECRPRGMGRWPRFVGLLDQLAGWQSLRDRTRKSETLYQLPGPIVWVSKG